MLVKKKWKLNVMISSWLLKEFYIHGGRGIGVFDEIVKSFMGFNRGRCNIFDVWQGCLMVLFQWWEADWGFSMKFLGFYGFQSWLM